MGFKPNRTYLLKFEGDEYEGLEVRTRSMPLGQFFDMAELIDLADLADGGRDLSPEDMQRMRTLFELFARALVSWNLEKEDDTPIPATLEGLLTLELGFVMTIIQQWMNVVSDVKGPLGNGSNGGGTSPEGSLPMAPLSENLSS